MRILNITAQKPHSTGSGTYLTELVKSFNRMGHKQSVVAGVYPEDEAYFPDGVEFYPVFFDSKLDDKETPKDGRIPFPIVGMSDVMPYVSTRYRDLTEEMITQFGDAFINTIMKAKLELRPDIIICHHLFLLTAMVRKKFPGEIIYGICHGTDLRQMRNCPQLREYVRPGIEALDKIFVLHDEQLKDVLELFGKEAVDKAEVIGSGYNEALFNTDGRRKRCEDDPVRVLYAGKMSGTKGVPELLEVLEELVAQAYMGKLPGFTVTLAGGCQDKSVETRLKDLPTCVNYIGQVPQEQLAEMFKEGDIFILPSYFEGLSLVLIEAMASGMIPISTDLPGMQDWINSNVANANVRYISRPEMKSVDEPTEKGRMIFVENMTEILAQAIKDVSEGMETDRIPSTAGITWMGVASKIAPY